MLPMNPQIPPHRSPLPRRIELVAFPDVQILDIAGPAQVFTAANELAVESGDAMPYEVRLVAPAGTRVKSTSGLSFVTEPLTNDPVPPDTLIVAGGRGVAKAAQDDALRDWISTRAAGARRVASVCTGAFLLAATGLLDGRRAVTHWRHCDQLSREYPQVQVDSDPIFVRDGNIWTSAGVTAGIDLSLALVEADLGRAIGLDVARNLVVFVKRPGGQAQFSAALALQATGERFAKLHEWVAEHLADDLSLCRLAQEAGMSERTFLRRYRESTGLTPLRAVERLRVEAARQMLIETQLPIKRIAARCGFGSEETMRRTFVRFQQVSPSDFRDRFGHVS
jgi:transcriptional regulator GlxA family with amidase domain